MTKMLKNSILLQSVSTLLSPIVVYCRVTPSIKFVGTHLLTCMERDTVRVKCCTREHMLLTRDHTRTSWSVVKCTNHEATTSLTAEFNPEG